MIIFCILFPLIIMMSVKCESMQSNDNTGLSTYRNNGKLSYITTTKLIIINSTKYDSITPKSTKKLRAPLYEQENHMPSQGKISSQSSSEDVWQKLKHHSVVKRNSQFLPRYTHNIPTPTKILQPPDDFFLLVPDLIEFHGYPKEEHEVTTADGYRLALHRIAGPGRKWFARSARRAFKRKGSVLLLHGFAASSADFVLGGPNNALGFMLADAGFDVWLGNVRGNTYSTNHNLYNSRNSTQFWSFSFDEMASEDLPSMVDYITGITGLEKISFVGHGTGATIFTMSSFVKKGFVDKINFFGAMGPVGFGKRSHSAAKVITNLARIGYNWRGDRDGRVLQRRPLALVWFFCNAASLFFYLCHNLLTTTAGMDSGLFTNDQLPYIVAHFPAGTSRRTFAHLGQMLTSAGVQRFNFGKEGNSLQYGQETPPQYSLDHVTCPTAVYWAPNDAVAPPEDVADFISKAPAIVRDKEVCQEKFGHLDFVFSTKARNLVHTDLISTMAAFQGSPS